MLNKNAAKAVLSLLCLRLGSLIGREQVGETLLELAALRPLLPKVLSYVQSFMFLGIYWNNHHGVPFNAKRCCSKELCLSSDTRVKRPASGSGTVWGGMPADNEANLRASPAERQLTLFLG
jgi:hypothetical protein